MLVFSSTPYDESAEPPNDFLPVPIYIFQIHDGIRVSRYQQEALPDTNAPMSFPTFLKSLPQTTNNYC
jgi:hypothetical protein